jgi:hypothetical protein
MIKKLWERIIDLLEKEYNLNYNSADIRFMYLIYFAYLNIDDRALARKSTEMVKKSWVDYCKQFADIEKITLGSYQRSIYRTINKINDSEIVDLAKIIKEIVEKVEI